jgi:hypothetical protein
MRIRRIVSIGIALGTIWVAALVVGGAAGQPGSSVDAHVSNIKWDPASGTAQPDSGTGAVTDVANIKWDPIR